MSTPLLCHSSEPPYSLPRRSSALARTASGLMLALACAGLAACGPATTSTATAAETLDTSRLPRVAETKQLYASPFSTVYMTSQSVGHAAGAIAKTMTSGGWKRYVAPFSDYATGPDFQMMSFKKGPQAIEISITRAPAQGNATSVSYTAIVLTNDLPVPADAADIAFDPQRPYLSCLTAMPVAKTIDYYTEALAPMGFALWPGLAQQAANKKANGGGDRADHAYFVRDGQKPLHLVLHRGDNEQTKIEIEAVSAEMLTAEIAPDPTPPVSSEERFHAKKPADAMDKMIDNAMQQMTDAILAATGEAVAEAAKPKPEPKKDEDDAAPPARSDTETPIPLPQSADNVGFDGNAGTLNFDSPSSVAALAAFYRKALKKQGWAEKRSVINRSNMVVLNFDKQGKTLSFTIMQMANYTTVDADGSGLVRQAAAPAAAPIVTGSIDVPEPAEAAAEAQLVTEDLNGFPIPESHTSTQSGETKYRSERQTTVPAPLKSVLAFYRRELPKRGWKETGGAIVSGDRAMLSLASEKGQGVLTLSRQDDETAVSFIEKREAEAKKAGILPKKGQARLILGSMSETPATVTIGKRTIKLAPGMGGGARPDGPMLDLPPGHYTYSVAVAGAPPEKDEVAVAEGEAWALVVGPAGGAMPLHMY